MSPSKLSKSAAALAMAAALAIPAAAQAAEAMRVVRDPKTGELRAPTAAEAAAFQKAEAQLRAAARKGAPARSEEPEITYPDGTVETKLDEDTMLSTVVQLAPDGSLRDYCLPAAEARALVKGSSKKTVAAKKVGQ